MSETLHSLDSRMARVHVEPGGNFDEAIKRALMSHNLLGDPRPRIGRYEIRRRLGSGGMGVVYAGHDEELDRTVALKLVHHHTSAAARLRFTREAQGLARLSHPNVVQIYEIGEHEGTSFLAMELVEGQTLKTWAKQGLHPWREVLKVLRDAGRGLAAVHAKRLVHRDFKPDNVMLGDDRRVLVMDFGLVHAGADTPVTGDSAVVEPVEPADLDDRLGTERELDLSSVSPLSNSLTKTGSLIGTPAYMAPEQYAGRATDARSDQFSFCVTAWELFYGQRPYSGTNVAQLFMAIADGRRDEPPADTRVPTWVRKVIARGLAADPAQRWPSMDALVDALARDPTHRRRWWTAGAGLLALAGAAIGARQLHAEAQTAATRVECAAEADAIGEAWTPERRAELAAGFMATRLPFAADSWTRTQTTLDAYAREWTALRGSTCVEARVDLSRSPEQLAAIVACLDDARAGFDATLEVLATADAGLVAHAGAVPSELPSLAACVDERQLNERVSPPESIADQVAELRGGLERVRALHRSARYPSALTRAHELVGEAEALAWAPIEAEALLVLGEQQHSLAQFDDASASFREAAQRAAVARNDALALRAVTKLARVIGYDLARYDEGLVWADTGKLLVARIGAVGSVAEALLVNERANIKGEAGDPVTADSLYALSLEILERELGPHHPHVAVVLHNFGGARYMQSDLEAAARFVERSLTIREEVYGPNHPIVADSLATLGTIRDEQSDYAQARTLHQRALDIRSVALGPEHPRVASSLLALGLLDLYAGDYDSARPLFERALAIQEQVHGEDHPRVADTLDYLAAIDARTDRLDQALALLERGLAIREATVGPENALYAHSLANVAEIHLMRGETDVALAQLEQALAINLNLPKPEPRDIATIQRRLGNLYAELGDLDRAIAESRRAVELFEDSLGPTHPEVGGALFMLGTMLLEHGDGPEAADALGRAIEIELVSRQGAGVLGDSAYTYARALWAAGKRDEARDWAKQAVDRFRADEELEPLAEVEAWQAEHGG